MCWPVQGRGNVRTEKYKIKTQLDGLFANFQKKLAKKEVNFKIIKEK